MASSTKPIGLNHALETLQKIDPVLVRQARKRMKDDLKPVAQAAKGSIPSSPPLSRWVEPGRGDVDARGVLRSGSQRMPVWSSGSAKRKIAIVVQRKRVKGFTGRRALVALRQNDAAGAVYDMAGKHPNVFGSNLTGRFGEPSRYMWPTVEKHRDAAVASVERAKKDMEREINARLRRRGSYDVDTYEQLRSMGYHHSSAMFYARGQRWR